MSEHIDLKALQREAHHAYNGDGVLDLSVGISLIISGILIYSGMSWLVFAAVPAGVSTYYALKKIVTIPRVGYVKFKLLDGGIMGKSFMTVAAIALISAIIVILTALVTKDALLVIGFIATATLVITGYVIGVKRLYAYGAVIACICLAGRSPGLADILLSGLSPETAKIFYILIPGALMLVIGVTMMAMFIAKYNALSAEVPAPER